MKFYYNGKLVRTSKTKHYKYGIVCCESVIACSETFENAQLRLEALVREHTRVAKSNHDFAQKPEQLTWLKETYGEDYDADEIYEDSIKRISLYKIVKLEER